MNRGAVGAIGNLLASERAFTHKVSDCERHVKVGVQGSGFVRFSSFGREHVGVPIATLPLQEDARASLKEVFVVAAERDGDRHTARGKL